MDDKEFPPLKRRTRIDFTWAEKNSSQKSVNAANLNVQEDIKSLSISDEEKHLNRSKRIHHDMDSEPRNLVSRCVPRAYSNPKIESTSHPEPRNYVRRYVPRPYSNPKITRAKESTSHPEPRNDVRRYVPRPITRAKESTSHPEKQAVINPFDICTCYNSISSRNIGNRIDTEYPITETRQILRPGMVLLTNYIPLLEQVNIINKCRELGLGPGGFYQPGYQSGAKLRLRMMCLGKRWDPETKYEENCVSNVPKTLDIPEEFVSLVKKALSDAHLLIKKHEVLKDADEMLPGMTPDICIVNYYTTNGKLGLHQDRDESKDSLRKGLPVVSFSVGDSAEFFYGDERDFKKAQSVLLKSGDVLIFGGESRHIYHGVASINPKTAPPALLKNTNLRPGRLNLTFRQF